jgi:cobalt-zinc-cadmium efflux system outer membrane protein
MTIGMRRWSACLLAGLLGVLTARAEPREIATSLTLDQVVQAALAENPQLRSLHARWEAMQERPIQERTLPDPTLAVKGGNGVDDFSFPKTQETRVDVEQTFPWFGKLGLKGKVAEKEAEATHREYEATVREVIMMAKENYFDLYAVQRSLSITRTEEDVLRQMQKIAETRYGVGEVTQQDVLKAQAEISMLKARVLELEQQESVLKAKLNQLLDRRADSPLGLAVTEPQREFEFQTEQLFGLAEKTRPEIKQAQAQVERSQAERDLMKKQFFPDYRLGVEYGHMNSGYVDFSGSENLLMFTVGIDLPIWHTKYRAGVREADKMIESSEAALEAAEKQTSYDVQDASFKLLTARRTLDLYQSALVPQAEARFNASEAGYRTGKVNFLDLLESERFLLNARVMAVTAEGNVGMQLARLERAVGTDLATSNRNGESRK